MRLNYVAAFLLTVSLSSSAFGQNNPVIRDFDVPTIEKFGRAIFNQDMAAARATDSVLGIISAQEKSTLRGWTTEERPDGTLVHIMETSASGLVVAYDVMVVRGVASQPTRQMRPLSAAEQGQYDARMLALKNVGPACSDHYNTVALKEEGADKWLVWALASTTDPNLVILSGHFRFTISDDGKTILNKDALFVSCIRQPKNAPDTPAGSKLAAFMVSTLVSPKPVETHIFTSLLYEKDLYVGASSGAWAISGGRMMLMEK